MSESVSHHCSTPVHSECFYFLRPLSSSYRWTHAAFKRKVQKWMNGMQRWAELSEKDPNSWVLWLGLVSVSTQRRTSKAERGRGMRFQILHRTEMITTLCLRCSTGRSDVFDVETSSKSCFPPSSRTTVWAHRGTSSWVFFPFFRKSTALVTWICERSWAAVVDMLTDKAQCPTILCDSVHSVPPRWLCPHGCQVY